MPAEKISDLIPLPTGCRNPHPYQVFGLEDGEQDNQKISAAIQTTVKHLKDCKDETDPAVWKKAAKLVNEAKKILRDPERKSELDAQFGIVSVSEPVTPPDKSPDPKVTTSTHDPLAGVLPAADPLAAVLPTADPMAPAPTSSTPPASPPPASALMPPSVQPPSASPPAPLPADLAPPASVATIDSAVPSIAVEDPLPGTSKSRGTSRRRRSSGGLFMFAGFMVSMMGVIGVLVYFVFFTEGQISISQRDGQLDLSNQPQVEAPSPDVQRENEPPKPRDPIMGDFAENFRPGPNSGRPSGLVSEMDDDASGADGDLAMPGMDEPPAPMMAPDMADPEPAPDSEPAPEPEPTPGQPTQPEPEPDPEPEPEMKSDPEPELSEAMIAEADTAVKRVEELIRTAKWKEMLPAAEQLLEMSMSQDQRVRAEALHELADLATYYRGGIEKAVADLSVGNDFEVTKDFRVIVVETGEDLLVVRFNERNKSFRFDEFSFPLTHKLASFAMPDSPGAKAAKAVYQAIAPRANEGYIEQSIEWLEAIDPETEEVDVARVIETLESLVSP